LVEARTTAGIAAVACEEDKTIVTELQKG